MADLLKNLKLDTWYKGVLYLGVVFLFVGLLAPVKGITNGQLELIGTGLTLIGLGEWKNWKVAAWIEPATFTTPALSIQAPVRNPDLVGVFFDIVGFVAIVLAVFSIVTGWHSAQTGESIRASLSFHGENRQAWLFFNGLHHRREIMLCGVTADIR